MKIILAIISLAAGGLVACTGVETTPAASLAPPITVSIDDFQILEGDGWNGELSYLNYGSDERSSIPVKLAITILDDRTMEYAIQYPGETQHNAKEKLKISRDGKMIDGDVLVSRETGAEGELVLTTMDDARDDNRPAEIQIVYTIAENTFRIKKNVRFDDDAGFFNRNVYSFSR